ncbi:hypothetical protein ACSQRO_004588, partial [Pseudomonas aeruginosa]
HRVLTMPDHIPYTLHVGNCLQVLRTLSKRPVDDYFVLMNWRAKVDVIIGMLPVPWNVPIHLRVISASSVQPFASSTATALPVIL